MSTYTGNLGAFLDTIAWSEIGPGLLAVSDDGYNVIVGSTPDAPDLITSYADHPRKSVWLPNLNEWSTAAGRYQVIKRYFDFYKSALGLPDFGRASQDRLAVQMIHECDALTNILAGQLADAISKCRSRWASLPGAGYGQHEQALAGLQAAYQSAGGSTA